MTIRDVDPERDAGAVVGLIRQTQPSAVIDEQAWLHRARTLPERARPRVWVAEADGRVVAYGYSLLNFFSRGSRNALGLVMVDEQHRRRGIGAALTELVMQHAHELGAESMVTQFDESPVGIEFASRRGFRELRGETQSVLDPRTVSERPRAELDLRPVIDVDAHLVYEVDVQATLDMPASEPHDRMSYDEWEEHVLEHPLFTPDGSFVVMEDDVAAAVSLLIADLAGRRAANMFTGTLRPYRGRGLALAVKLASIRWAAENGITSMRTANDETNAPMLAINRRLGYEIAGRRVEYAMALTPTGTASSPALREPAR